MVVPLPVNLTVRDYCLVMERGRGNGTSRAGASVCVVYPKINVIKCSYIRIINNQNTQFFTTLTTTFLVEEKTD